MEIHFNTTNIVDDSKDISENLRFQELHSLPKCTLSRLDVYRIPLTIDELSLEIVVGGMIDIFPSLGRCERLELIWDEIPSRIEKLREA